MRYSSKRKKTDNGVVPPATTRRLGAAVAAGQPRRREGGRLEAVGGLLRSDDATYGWNIGPKEDVMCVGIDEIRDIALGLEMDGLEGGSTRTRR